MPIESLTGGQKRKPDFDLTEIIGGKERMTPSPLSYHQRIVYRLSRKIADYIEKKDLGEVFISPLDVILEEDVARLQPDIIIIKKDNLSIVQDWIRGIPDLVIEVVSTGTFTRDAVEKKEIYQKYSVPEYWLVIPELKAISVFVIADEKYQLFSSAEEEGKVNSHIIEGLEIDISKLWG